MAVLLYVCIIFSNNKTIFKNGSIGRETAKELGPLGRHGMPWKTYLKRRETALYDMKRLQGPWWGEKQLPEQRIQNKIVDVFKNA